MQPYTEFDVTFQFFTSQKNLTVDPRCNAWTIVNVGTTILNINGFLLNPGVPGTNTGEQLTMAGNAGEIFKGRLTCKFSAAAGSEGVFIQKVYTNNNC